MNRLLIVDNEHIVVDSLLSVFEKRLELNLDACGAYSAEEAISLMERAKVDILLTDIKMPGMNGLELQREVAQRWPWCRTLFLTGYNDFSFVQEAIRLGGIDYLLKTEGTDAIITAVEKAAGQIDNRRKSDELIKNASALVAKAQPLLQHKLLISLLNGWVDLKGIAGQFETYSIRLNRDGAWLIYARLDDIAETDELGYEVALAAIESVVKDYLGVQAQFMQVEYTRSAFVWLVSFDNCWPDKRKAVYLQGVAEAAQQHLVQKLGLHISACVSHGMAEWGDMPGALARLRSTLNRALYMGGGDDVTQNVLLTETQDTAAVEYVNAAIRDSLDGLQRIDAYLECGNRFGFHEAFLALKRVLAGASVTARLEMYHSMLAIFMKHINRWELMGFIAGGFDLGALDGRMGWDERMKALEKLADAIFEAKRLSGLKAGDDLIARINWYIDSNLGGDLSLLQLGEMEGMNPYYLARIYRKLTGENLKSYISAKRVRKACSMLRQSDMKNRDIGLTVGFQTEQSFYRFFKKMCGMTPQEYRDGRDVQN